MVLGTSKLSVPGRPAGLNDSRVGVLRSCGRSGRGLLDIFSLVFQFCFSFSLSLGDGPI